MLPYVARKQDVNRAITMEKRTARLTLLVDPNKKIAFEKLCALEDVTPSQKIRQFMRDYIEEKLGVDWREEVFNGNDVAD
jgi:two-component SAPR family response regulator